MRFCLTAVTLVLFASFAAHADDKKAAAELKALVGNWKIEKVELGGKDITEHLKEMKFDIHEGGKYTAQVGELKDEATFTIDVSKSPKQMEVKPTGGPNKGQIVKAIYKLDGDTLTLCYDHEANKGTYPAKFESKENTMLLLIVYKREKK